MPVFPHTRWRWDPVAWSWADNHDPGSPYAARDYSGINPWPADNSDGTRHAAFSATCEVRATWCTRGNELSSDPIVDWFFGDDSSLGPKLGAYPSTRRATPTTSLTSITPIYYKRQKLGTCGTISPKVCPTDCGSTSSMSLARSARISSSLPRFSIPRRFSTN